MQKKKFLIIIVFELFLVRNEFVEIIQSATVQALVVSLNISLIDLLLIPIILSH